MAKRHGRPSSEYRYEHYDPRVIDAAMGDDATRSRRDR